MVGNDEPSSWIDPARADLLRERNAFYGSLPPLARQAFLDALEQAKERGLPDEAAWRAAVRAAEHAYDDAEALP